MKMIICFFLPLLIISKVAGQNLEIRNIQFRDNKVEVTYMVDDTVQGRYYTVRMYSSHDNYLNPLKEVTGEIGVEIQPGGERLAIWNVYEEWSESFNGNISLELRARVYIPFIKTEWFDDVITIRRKHAYEITWRGGREQNILNFDLYKGDTKVTTFANVANVGHYVISLPGDVKPGNNYRFKISDTRNLDEVVYTPTFKVKRKFPFLVTSVMPLVLTSVGVMIISQLNDPYGTGLPDAPGSPENR